VGKKRIWEIDFLRALAIFLMVVFHFVYDLNEFIGVNVDYLNGFWYWEGKVSAIMFMIVAGISSGLSKNTVKRGFKVLGFGMVISIATYIVFKEEYVRFGILHFLGVSMIFFPLIHKVNNWVLAVITLLIGFAAIPVNEMIVNTSLLIPFGFMYRGFVSVDYYPLIPYLSAFIVGVLAYKIYYYRRESLFDFSFENRVISVLSRNSLAIYVLHQPILLVIIFAIKMIAVKV
jgi:uncharacterized membrane protein